MINIKTECIKCFVGFFFLPVFCLKFALLLHALFDKTIKNIKLSRGSALKGKGTPLKIRVLKWG